MWLQGFRELLAGARGRNPGEDTDRAGANLEAVCTKLASDLGPFGYQWLCACAVYPGLRLPITSYLGVELARRVGRSVPDETEHMALARLPWFRVGWMPDELRMRLLRDLRPEFRGLVREAIEAMFHAAARRPARQNLREAPEVARPPARWSRRFREWLAASPRDAAGSDMIFVRYMMGRTPRPGDLTLGRDLARLFGARLAGWLDRSILLGLAATAFSLVILATHADSVLAMLGAFTNDVLLKHAANASDELLRLATDTVNALFALATHIKSTLRLWYDLITGLPGRLLPGVVRAEIGPVSFTAPMPVVVVGVLALFFGIYLIFRTIAAIVSLPSRVRSRRRRQMGDTAVTRTLLALSAGDAVGARRETQRARRFLGDTPQTLLLAAEASRLGGREGEAESAFRSLAGHPDAAFLGLRGLLRQAITRQDWTEAASLARKAESEHPGAVWLRADRAELAIRTGAWSDALMLADGKAPKAALATAAAAVETDARVALRLTKQAWQENPSLAPAALAYAGRLRAAGRESRALAVIRHSWSVAPHPDLAGFALAPVTEPLGRMQAAQRLTEANPAHTESRLLLARIALDAGLVGEARRHAEAARTTGLNQRRLWLLQAEIEEAEGGGTEAGRIAQRDALRQAATADPDPVWRCGACHTTHQTWHPACPDCFTVASLRWSETVLVKQRSENLAR